MRTEIKKIDIYEFDELSEEIQEKLLEKEIQQQREMYCTDGFLYEDMAEKARRLLEKYFGDKASYTEVYYDLSYSQGSGAMIEFETTYYGVYVQVRQRGLYYHERSFDIDYEGYLGEKRYNQLREKIIKMNIELGKSGYSILEDEDNFRDGALLWLEEQEFTKDGEIY